MNSSIVEIKDSIFECLIMGMSQVETISFLHFEVGYSKEDIIAAWNEMVEEANKNED